MREFRYAAIRARKWDSEVVGLIAAIYRKPGSKSCIFGSVQRKWKS